ncbi:ribonuclease HI [Salmonella enterica]|nr:ribonuclease HI [Salmonella enterica]
MIEIYTDGASSPQKTQAAGWAFAISPITGEQWKVFYGYLPPPSTNNIAELLGVINGLKILWKFSNCGERCIPPARIISDSQYVINSVLEWRRKWEYEGMPPKNTELLLELFNYYDKVCSICELELKWVKGHAGNIGNEIADQWSVRAKENSSMVLENNRFLVRKVVGSFNEFIGI